MKKITLQTPNITAQNIDKIAELFPNCITETKDENGTLKKAVNIDVLKQMLSEDIMEGAEAYEFTWVGKRAATVEAFKPIDKTLRPCPEESVDWDNTQNLYIEGDNLEVLKLLQENYLKKVKMIYIDPPYNTGNDFIYMDDFRMSEEEWEEESDEYDEEGNRLYRNTESNGRFHSDWCSMIYSRLLLARGLLTDDGAIFISIDDNESSNLRKICDEIFGAQNFVVEMINITGASQNGEGVKIQKNTESCFVYAKNFNLFFPNKVDKADESLRNLNDSPTPFITRPEMGYTIYYNPETEDIIPVKDYNKDKIETNIESKVYKNVPKLIKAGYIPIRPGYRSGQLNRWRWGLETFKERINEIIICENKGKYSVYFKQSGVNPPKNILNYIVGTNEIKNLFDEKRIFDFPKSVKMLSYLLKIGTNPGDLVLDFFSGSATTAHAVMQLNAEDGGNRRFIMVQIPEECDENSEAFKAGYSNICEIGKERIRRAGAKIKESIAQKDSLFSSDAPELDTGFRVFKVADSNMNDVDIQLSMYSQDKLDQMVDNIKADRTALDLLFGCALEWGLELTMPYTSEQIGGCTVHTYSQGESIDLIACFDKDVPVSTFRAIAKKKPLRVVFRDSCFKDCPSKINAEELIRTLSPKTDVRVI